MAIVDMRCPHCGEDEVFEALEPIQVKLSFDNWKVGSVEAQIPKDAIWSCVGCGGWAAIDFRNRLVLKRNQPVPIFDAVVQGILEFAREMEGGEIARESALDSLRDRNYRGLSFITTWKNVISIILEQRP